MKDNWRKFSEHHLEIYNEGYDDAKNGYPYLGDKKYPPSGHERDTTYMDECNFAYYCGYEDFEDKYE